MVGWWRVVILGSESLVDWPIYGQLLTFITTVYGAKIKALAVSLDVAHKIDTPATHGHPPPSKPFNSRTLVCRSNNHRRPFIH